MKERGQLNKQTMKETEITMQVETLQTFLILSEESEKALTP